jgi:hypothetical protein
MIDTKLEHNIVNDSSENQVTSSIQIHHQEARNWQSSLNWTSSGLHIGEK